MFGQSRLALLFAVVAPSLAAAPRLVPGAHVAVASPACRSGDSTALVITATTDVHGYVRGWDYYGNREDPVRGLTRAATIVDSVRRAAPGRVLLVGAGDLLQGNPFTYTVARVTRTRRNAVIAAMNSMRYDAAAIGNHEFNYGVPYLDSAIAQARFPFLAANARFTDRAPRHRARPYRGRTLVQRAGLRVAIVGATTPGSNVWDATNLEAVHLHIDDILPAVAREVRDARARGADVIVVLLHSGLDEPSSYDTVTTERASENVAARVAREVPGIDVLIYGHSHKQNRGEMIGSTFVIQPLKWATSVAVVTLPATCTAGRWRAGAPTGVLIPTAHHAEAPEVVRATQRVHDEAKRYVSSTITTTPDTWRGDSARLRDVPLTDFILAVEQRAANADLASTAAFDTAAHFGPGPITVAQVAQLYPYDNTLRAVRISGAQLRSYLEYSSRYYRQSPTGAPVVDTTVASYNFDVVSGVDYTLDLARPVGERVVALTHHGRAVAPTDSFTLALNNYRQTGGGGYAMLRGAPVVYDRQQEISQLLIDELRRRPIIRQSDYFVKNWSILPPRSAR